MFRIAQPSLPKLTSQSALPSKQNSSSMLSSLRKTCAQFHVKSSDRNLQKNPSLTQHSIKSQQNVTHHSQANLLSESGTPMAATPTLEARHVKRKSSNTYRSLKNKALQDWINQESPIATAGAAGVDAGTQS